MSNFTHIRSAHGSMGHFETMFSESMGHFETMFSDSLCIYRGEKGSNKSKSKKSVNSSVLDSEKPQKKTKFLKFT